MPNNLLSDSPCLKTLPANDNDASIAILREEMLDELLKIEQDCYSNPWSRRNFEDALHTPGYYCIALQSSSMGELMGYFIALKGIDEVHLLNITVAPRFQKHGCALVMLENLRLWAISLQMPWIWLEVRQSNIRAQAVYTEFGFIAVGIRRNYYPVAYGVHEDAILMSLRVC